MPVSEEVDATDRHRVQMCAVRAVTLCGGDGHLPGPACAECRGSPNSKGPLSRVTDTLGYTRAGTTGGELSASIAGALHPRAPCPKPACPLVSTRVQDARLHAQCCVCGHPSPRRVRASVPDASWCWRTRGRVLRSSLRARWGFWTSPSVCQRRVGFQLGTRHLEAQGKKAGDCFRSAAPSSCEQPKCSGNGMLQLLVKGTSGDGAPYPVSGGHARHSAERRQQARSIWASRGTLPDATDAGELRQGSVSREQGRFRGEARSSLGVSGAWTRGPLTAVAVSASRHPLPKPPQFSKQGEKQHRHGHARRDRTEPPGVSRRSACSPVSQGPPAGGVCWTLLPGHLTTGLRTTTVVRATCQMHAWPQGVWLHVATGLH